MLACWLVRVSEIYILLYHFFKAERFFFLVVTLIDYRLKSARLQRFERYASLKFVETWLCRSVHGHFVLMFQVCLRRMWIGSLLGPEFYVHL